MHEVVRQTADQVFIPLTVGGGIRSVADMRAMLNAGADKISINSSALKNPALIKEGAEAFGSQCIVVAIDAKRVQDTPLKWRSLRMAAASRRVSMPSNGPKRLKNRARVNCWLLRWTATAQKDGYDVQLLEKLHELVSIPSLPQAAPATWSTCEMALPKGRQTPYSLPPFFILKSIPIGEAKEFLKEAGINVRMVSH